MKLNFLLILLTLFISSCDKPTDPNDPFGDGSGGGDSFHNYSIDVTVNNSSTGVPITNVRVKIWIVDKGLNAEFQTTKSLGTKNVNSQGKCSFTYRAIKTPSVCGYEVYNSSGQIIVQKTPSKNNSYGWPYGAGSYNVVLPISI